MGTPRSLKATLALAVCLSAFTIDIALTAIPEIVGFFDAMDSQGHLVVAIYLAGYALGQIPIGVLSDRYGRLPVFYACLLLFALASVGLILAESIEVFLFARFLQGLAGASGPVIARAIARDLCSGLELAKLTATLVAALAISTLLAPILGSLIAATLGWRSILTAILIFCAAIGSAVFFCVPETRVSEDPAPRFVQQINQSLAAFLSAPTAIWGLFLISLTYFGYMGLVAGIPLVLSDSYGFPSEWIGIVFGSLVLSYILATQFGSLLLKHFGPLRICSLGALAYGVSAVILAYLYLSGRDDFWLFCLCLLPFLIGMGLMVPNAMAFCLAPLPGSAGFAASLVGLVQIGFATCGAMLVGLLYSGNFESLLFVLWTGCASTLVVFLVGLNHPLIKAGTVLR